MAETNTINSRLQAEVEEAVTKQRGPRSKIGERLRRALKEERGQRKSDEERLASIEAARDLNGVDPVLTTALGLLSIGAGVAIYSFLASFIVPHFYSYWAVPDDAPYAFKRATGAFRTGVVAGMTLMSGFCGLAGVGVTALGLRVGVGVAKGELDPTKISDRDKLSRDSSGNVQIPDIWGLMTGKKNVIVPDENNPNDPFGY